MKRTLILLSLLSLLTGCGTPKPKVDLSAELKKQPSIEVSWKGEDKAPSVSGGFCSSTLCMDNGEPDWASLTFTPYTNGTPITVKVTTTLSLKQVSLSLKDDTGHTVENNLSSTDEGDNTYLISSAFNHTGNMILSVKVNFADDGGYGQTYFPLNVE